MQQMPREGRSFCLVDKNWKQIMAKAVVSFLLFILKIMILRPIRLRFSTASKIFNLSTFNGLSFII